MPRNVFIVISAALFVLISALSWVNASAIAVYLFGPQLSMPLGAVIFGSFAIGFIAALSGTATTKLKEIKSEQNKLEWQRHDEKLAKEIQSDKEKQLEAKIETLEVALKSALDKNKRKTQETEKHV